MLLEAGYQVASPPKVFRRFRLVNMIASLNVRRHLTL